MPFPPEALDRPAPQRVRMGFEGRYPSKSNAREDAAGTECEKVRQFALGRDLTACLDANVTWRVNPACEKVRQFALGCDLTACLDANVTWWVNTANAQRCRYGDALLHNVGFARRAGSVLELSLQVNGHSARHDEADGISGENTGGSVLYACPTARWFTGAGIVLESGAQFPIQGALDGEQEEHATARFALSLAR